MHNLSFHLTFNYMKTIQKYSLQMALRNCWKKDEEGTMRGRITRRVTKFKSAVLYSIILSSPALYMLCCLQKFRVLKQNMCKEHLFESQSSRIKSQITRSIIVVGTSISSLSHSPSRSLRIYWTESLCMLCNFLGNECEKTSDSLFVIIESHFKRERRIELNINLHLPIEMRKMKTSYQR